MVHRLREGAGALRAELGHSDVELFLAAANGLVSGDQLFLRQLGERRHIQPVQL